MTGDAASRDGAAATLRVAGRHAATPSHLPGGLVHGSRPAALGGYLGAPSAGPALTAVAVGSWCDLFESHTTTLSGARTANRH
jgi:hypothetical protein